MADNRFKPYILTRCDEVQPYRTRDGSLIRELMHPEVHGNQQVSVAEATIEPGAGTDLHIHHTSEEIYFVIQGAGIMTLGDEVFAIGRGDTVCINPKQPHRVENTGNLPLKILCCCAPSYSHDDTEIIDEMV